MDFGIKVFGSAMAALKIHILRIIFMKKSLWLKALSLTLCVMLTVCLGLTVPVFAADEFSVWDGSVETDWLKDSEKPHTDQEEINPN